ncbi:hypothetical protein EON65_02985 [archaeon]|nr:MAG: hypothetical protein EON65_02985 [archaeon]
MAGDEVYVSLKNDAEDFMHRQHSQIHPSSMPSQPTIRVHTPQEDGSIGRFTYSLYYYTCVCPVHYFCTHIQFNLSRYIHVHIHLLYIGLEFALINKQSEASSKSSSEPSQEYAVV